MNVIGFLSAKRHAQPQNKAIVQSIHITSVPASVFNQNSKLRSDSIEIKVHLLDIPLVLTTLMTLVGDSVLSTLADYLQEETSQHTS